MQQFSMCNWQAKSRGSGAFSLAEIREIGAGKAEIACRA